ncbi:hypothetical protein C365_03262 [Cryptococcus neoformans Bt85]|nr:hypothetical protein C365_03262 [Cryptococcus neoformans var. grubii Bt85]
MQPSQPAQSSSSKRHSSAEPSQTQTGASAAVPLEPTTNASKRSKKNPAVSAGQATDGTPPAEENWWTDRKIDWEKDCGGEGQQSSFAYFKDWIPAGISYMSGTVGAYTLERGAKEFQRFLYEKKGPIKRSVKSIEAKCDSMRKGWKTAYNLTQEMELELETETSSQSIHRQAMRIFPMIVSLITENATVPITTSETRFSKADKAQDLCLGRVPMTTATLL